MKIAENSIICLLELKPPVAGRCDGLTTYKTRRTRGGKQKSKHKIYRIFPICEHEISFPWARFRTLVPLFVLLRSTANALLSENRGRMLRGEWGPLCIQKLIDCKTYFNSLNWNFPFGPPVWDRISHFPPEQFEENGNLAFYFLGVGWGGIFAKKSLSCVFKLACSFGPNP